MTWPKGRTRGAFGREPDRRPPSAQRRRNREWMVATFGDGESVQCSHCPTPLTVDTVTADRVIPGREGGTYRRSNIIPSCIDCARKEGARVGAAIRREKRIHGTPQETELGPTENGTSQR